MIEELVHLLDRQFAFLLEQTGPGLFRELRRTLAMLRRDPRFAALLEEERSEVRGLIAASRSLVEETVRQSIAIRDEFVRLAPALDDTAAVRTEMSEERWLETFAAFDAIASGESLRILYAQDADQTRAAQLNELLYQRFTRGRRYLADGEQCAEDQAPQLDPLQQRFLDLREAYTREWRRIDDEKRTAPGAALLWLEDCVNVVSGRRIPLRAPELSELNLPWRMPIDDQPIYGRNSNVGATPFMEEWTNSMKEAIRRLHHGLRLRIGSLRSIRAVFDRFKARCELHDRERLLSIAEMRGKTRGSRTQAERALTDELARYLFDQGLNPLTEVPMGAARADALEPEALYVEAKQYAGKSPRSYILRGTRQVFEMMGRLRATRYRVNEAFFVVFRRSGPLCVFPPEVCFEGWTLRPLLIDLAPAVVAGSRAVRRVEIFEAEIRRGT